MALVRKIEGRTLLEKIVEHQAHELEVAVGNLGLEVPVKGLLEKRKRSTFDDALFFGYTGVDSWSAAHFLGGQGAEYNGRAIHPVLIPQTEEGSLDVGGDNSLAGANCFFILEDGIITPVVVDVPVPVQGFGSGLYTQTYTIPPHLQTHDQELANALELKHRTNTLLGMLGVPTTQGALARLDIRGHAQKIIERIAATHPEFVVKPDIGCMGAGVRFFRADQTAAAIQYAKKLRCYRHVLVEGRVRSPNIFGEEGRLYDWNVRSLVALPSSGEPQFIDAEVRYRLDGTGPVNVKKGAKVEEWAWASAATGIPFTLLEERSIQVGHAVMRLAREFGLPTQGYIGLDLIGPDLRVMEINGNAGGVETLTKMRKKPLHKLATRYLPTLGSWLAQNDVKETSYVPMVRTTAGATGLATLLGKVHRFPDAARVLEKELLVSPEDDDLRRELYRTYVSLGNPAQAVETIAPLAQRKKPELKDVMCALTTCIESEQYETGIQFAKKFLRMNNCDLARTRLGMLYNRVGEYALAQEHLFRVYEGDSFGNSDTVLEELGIANLGLKNYDSARAYFELFYVGRKAEPRAALHLVEVYDKLGVTEGLVTMVEHTLAYNEGHPALTAALDKLLST